MVPGLTVEPLLQARVAACYKRSPEAGVSTS